MSDNLSIIKKSYELGAKGDIPGMLADLSEKAEWTEIAGGPYGGTYIGAEEVIKNVFERIGADWEQFACIPEEFHDAGDTIVMTGWYSGVHAKTKKSFKVRVAHVWKLADGKIIKFEQFTDSAGMLAAMTD